MKCCAATLSLFVLPWVLPAAEPSESLSNGQIEAKVYLPGNDGYYQGKRFDWSGVVYSVRYKGHEYFAPWFDERRAPVNDFIYEGGKVVTGAASSITGPAEEYAPLGFEEAAKGGVFVKLGVGALRKPDDKPYDHYVDYPFVERGKWTVTRGATWVTFRHELTAPNGYGYVYTKTIRLADRQPRMLLEHSLRNTGKVPIRTSGYNHNFVTIDGKAPGPGYAITMPFEVSTPTPIENGLAVARGKQVVFQKPLQGEDRVFTPLLGFSAKPSDYDFRFESKSAGAGVRVTGDRPLLRATMWSIRKVVSVEPFIQIDVAPGQESTWRYTYEFYELPR